MFLTITLNPTISVSCSKDILFDCILRHIEKGVFSLPVISACIFWDFKSSLSSSETCLIISSLLFLIKDNLSRINFLASELSMEKDKLKEFQLNPHYDVELKPNTKIAVGWYMNKYQAFDKRVGIYDDKSRQ